MTTPTKSAKTTPQENIKADPCLFNLIAYCQNEERLEYVERLIQNTIAYFPCRIALIQRHLKATEPPITTQRSFIQSSRLNSSFACEQLFIEVDAHTAHQVPFFLFPFIQSDLPLFLIWDCDPTKERDILPSLQHHASRLIFDSETIDHLQHFSDRFLPYSQLHDYEIVDLNWTRIGGWREVIGKIFDTEERLQELAAAQSIRLTYNALESRFFHHSQTQAIYLQSWLASQLGWNYRSLKSDKGRSEIFYHAEGKEIQVFLEPANIGERAPGSIASLELLSTSGKRVLVTRKPGTQQVNVETSSDKACTLPYYLNLRGTQPTYTFLKEILYLKGSEHYKRMLKMLKHQDWNRSF